VDLTRKACINCGSGFTPDNRRQSGINPDPQSIQFLTAKSKAGALLKARGAPLQRLNISRTKRVRRGYIRAVNFAGFIRAGGATVRGTSGVLPFESKFKFMKNESLSFKLLALVIIAGVIAAFLDTSSNDKSTAKAAPALVSTAGQTE
jgi:hypothetical protein